MINKLHKIIGFLAVFFGNCWDTIISIPKILLQSRFLKPYPAISHQKAVILANGPSLLASMNEHLAFIKLCELYCVNNFASSTFFQEVKPQNYVLLDPAYFSFDPQNSNREDIQQTFFALLKVSWPMNLFVPIHGKNAQLIHEIIEKNKLIRVNYFNYTIVKGFARYANWVYAHRLGMPQCQNILGASLYLAIVRQHQAVYLFGTDHSWHEELKLNENNELIGRQIHFYDAINSIAFEKIKNNGLSKMYLQFQSLAKAFYSYEVLSQFAAYQGVKIYNASKRSYIDAFEKIKL